MTETDGSKRPDHSRFDPECARLTQAKAHYTVAAELLAGMHEPLPGDFWPSAPYVQAQWHMAFAQALEGMERTHAARQAQIARFPNGDGS